LEDQGLEGGNIRMDRRDTEWKGVDWMHLAQDRDQWRTLLNTLINPWVSYNAGNLFTGRLTVSF